MDESPAAPHADCTTLASVVDTACAFGYEPAASGRENEADHPAAERRRPEDTLELKTMDARVEADGATVTTPAAPVPVSERCDTGTRLDGSKTIASPPAI